MVRHAGGQSRLLVPASTSVLYPLGWSAGGGRLLAAQGETEFTLKALLITPSSGQVVTFAPTFSEIDGLSKNGRHVLGVVDGNVVTAAADGSSRVLASSASSASWTR